MQNFQLPLVVTIALVFLGLRLSRKRRSKHPPLPPGPRGWPVVGNMLSMPKTHLWYYFDDVCKKYGPLVTLSFASQTFIVVGSYEVAQELLVRRSANNSSRPPSYAFDLMAKGRRFIFLRDSNPGWKIARKMVAQVMGEVRQGRIENVQEFECKFTIQRILSAPEDWKAQFQRFAGSSILTAVYGIHVERENTGELRRLHERAKRTNILANPRAFIVNAFPFLDMIIPTRFAPWRTMVAEVEAETSLFDELCEKGLRNGEIGGHNWITSFHSNKEYPNLMKTSVTLPLIAGEMFGAGVNTTWITLQNFVLASLLYPEAFNKARKEIDAVVGSTRLPTFADRPGMVQTEAVFREIIRWRTAVPHGLYHEQTADDTIEVSGKQYFIPKGAVVVGNIYSIEHDERMYSNPHSFDPERHIEPATGALRPDTSVAFGFGRRACVGQPFAEKSIWIMMSHLIWLFQIERVPGDSSSIDPRAETGSATAHPLPFRAQIVSRSKEHEAIAAQDWEAFEKHGF
ncbi:cytochrome P450 [Meredithblackwellia eburnea MCA 4105]